MGGMLIHTGRGKQSIVLDTRTEEGLDVVKRLVERADVVIQNFRPGGAESAGVGYDSCKAWNKDIIFLTLTHKP